MKNIQIWQQQQLSNVKSHTLNPLFVDEVDKYLKNHSKKSRNILLKEFTILKTLKDYDNVMLVRTDGAIEISIDPKTVMLENESVRQLQNVLRDKMACFGDIFKSAILKDHLYLDIMAPVINEFGNSIAVLVVRLNPFRELSLRCEIGTTSPNSPYTYAIDKNDSSFSIIKDSSLIRFSTSSELIRALLRKENRFIGRDSDNQISIGQIQKIKGTDLYLVSEIKYDLILKSFRRYSRLIIFLNFLVVVGLIVSIIIIFQYRQKNTFRGLLNAELAFREEHERFRITLYSIGDGVITTDNMGFITNMNSVASKYTGWHENEARGNKINKVFYVTDEKTRAKIKRQSSNAFSESEDDPADNAEILVSRYGDEYYISKKETLIQNVEGKIIGSVLVFQDQTSQRLSEKALKQSDSRLRRAERIANIGHWELHLDSNLMFVSDSMKSIVGLNTKFIDYNKFSELILEDCLETRSLALKKLINENKSYDIEFKIRRISDHNILDIHSIAEYDTARNIVFGIIQEITEFRLTQKKLLQSNEELKNLNSMKDRIFSIIAHDLRNPVGSILSLSDFMVQMSPNLKDGKEEKLIPLINTIAKNAMDLLENLLYWARLQNNQFVFDPQMLFLKTTVDEVIDFLESSAKMKQIEIQNHVSNEIVIADSNMLKTILRNLISNAIKFTKTNGLIEINVDQCPGFSRITVKDNGVGMSEKVINNLFRSETIQTTLGTANEKGSGLGLLICKEFAEKHQGKIWVESEEGVGSSFCFTLLDKIVQYPTNNKISDDVL